MDNDLVLEEHEELVLNVYSRMIASCVHEFFRGLFSCCDIDHERCILDASSKQDILAVITPLAVCDTLVRLGQHIPRPPDLFINSQYLVSNEILIATTPIMKSKYRYSCTAFGNSQSCSSNKVLSTNFYWRPHRALFELTFTLDILEPIGEKILINFVFEIKSVTPVSKHVIRQCLFKLGCTVVLRSRQPYMLWQMRVTNWKRSSYVWFPGKEAFRVFVFPGPRTMFFYDPLLFLASLKLINLKEYLVGSHTETLPFPEFFMEYNKTRMCDTDGYV